MAVFGDDRIEILRVWWYARVVLTPTLACIPIANAASTLEWFFGRGSWFAAAVPHTLAYVMYDILAYAMRHGQSCAAEMLLSSAVFTDVMSPIQQTNFLNGSPRA